MDDDDSAVRPVPEGLGEVGLDLVAAVAGERDRLSFHVKGHAARLSPAADLVTCDRVTCDLGDPEGEVQAAEPPVPPEPPEPPGPPEPPEPPGRPWATGHDGWPGAQDW